MAASRRTPAFSFFSAFGRLSPAQPLRTLIRSTRFRLLPPRPMPYKLASHKAENAVLAAGRAKPIQRATILREYRRGGVPTIVLGGFVPDATEQVFLLRNSLLKNGSVYYVNYSPEGFSNELFFAQLEDLIEDLAHVHGQRPVIFSVSFGVGLVLEWLRLARENDRKIYLRGLVFISPVACIEDLLPSGSAKPTLLGRAIKPLVAKGFVDGGSIQRSRNIFIKMFEAGAKNGDALQTLMSGSELRKLREAVISTIQNINDAGACERVQALAQMRPPSTYFSQKILPLSDVPTLILYAEKESSVLTDDSPTRFALESAHRAYFPHSHFRIISNQRGTPVQHASLIFHRDNFLPPISAFYKHVKTGKIFKNA